MCESDEPPCFLCEREMRNRRYATHLIPARIPRVDSGVRVRGLTSAARSGWTGVSDASVGRPSRCRLQCPSASDAPGARRVTCLDIDGNSRASTALVVCSITVYNTHNARKRHRHLERLDLSARSPNVPQRTEGRSNLHELATRGIRRKRISRSLKCLAAC